MSDSNLSNFPKDLLICPVCASPITQVQCSQCNTEFFNLGNIPCIFTTGIQQQKLWQHQMAMMEAQGSEAIENMEYLLQGYDVTPRTRERLEIAKDAMAESLTVILDQLRLGGLESQYDEFYSQQSVDNPTEYYHHILRDWAWDNEDSKHYETHINDANLNRVLNVWKDAKPKNMLLLGAGAGRLSWDLHKSLKPEWTIASDINPFLLSCADTLIKRREVLSLPELYTYPQIGKPYCKTWNMQPPEDSEGLADSWFALGADVWNMPFKAQSMNSIVTSWLIDVCGGDAKELVQVLSYLLEPGGTWVNTGPLLYSSNLGFDLKYSAEEIFEFADMAGFDIEQHSVEEHAHMASPLNVRYHHEQVQTFVARKRVQAKPLAKPGKTQDWLCPSWLVLHHQPVPNIEFKCQMGHDFIKQVLDLVDGERSIYLISHLVQPTLPEGVDAKDAVVALFGQILEQMALASD